jgi:hypothetical protein
MTILLIIIRSFLELPGAYTFVVILSLLLNFNALSLLFFWNHSCYIYKTVPFKSWRKTFILLQFWFAFETSV